MRAKFKILFTALAFFIWTGICIGSPTSSMSRLIVRGSDNYPPFEFLNNSGEPDGFNIDILHALMTELGYKYDLKLENWSDVVKKLKEKKIDIAIGMIYSPERASTVRFTLPTCTINRNFVTREKDDYHSFSDLQGKEVVVEKGSWFHHYLLENNINVKIIESGNIPQGLTMLANGKYDAVLTGELVAYYAIKKQGIKGLKIHPMGIAPQNYGLAVSRDRDSLMYQFNIGLQRLKSSGVYDQIYNKWFGIYESNKNKEILYAALMIFLFVSALLILFVWLLRKRVACATRMLNYSQKEVGIAIDAGKISAWAYMIDEQKIYILHGRPMGLIDNGESVEYIQKVYEKLHPDDLDMVKKEFKDLSAGTKQTSSISIRVKLSNHSAYRYAEARMMRVEATKEHPCRILGTLKDITEEVMMRHQLEDYRLKTEFIVRTNQIVLIQYDIASRTFTRINEANSPDEKSYTITQYMDMVHPEDKILAANFIETMDRAEEKKIESEFRIVENDGLYYWFTITATAYKYNAQGDITSYIGLRRNNQKWKAINNDLIQLKEKADASNHLKSAFLANMSHEIRTPLNAIVGFSELIADTDNKEERDEFIRIVKTNNTLLLQLINDVLDLSYIESGHVTFNYTTFNFADYIKELGASLKLKETDCVKLICTEHYENLKICSDQKRISQVITNFVTNAFKFTRQGSVTLDYICENDGVKISVIDTGIGISPESQTRIFDRFEKINDFAQGTGLGLSICKEIAEALQGQIGVDSKSGCGSKFWFWIPCNIGMNEGVRECDLQMQSIASLMHAVKADSHTIHLDKKTILVADDIENNFTMIQTLLKDQYNIIRAENGLEAVEKAQVYNPNIILMDMKMPLMDGLEATRRIRKFNTDVPIIALTAYVFDTNKVDAIDAGCNDFLAKPVNRNMLLPLIRGYF